MRRLGLSLLVLLAAAPAAHAGPGSGPTAAVSLGDSYISGEAGRWAGNSIGPLPGHDGTDRACDPAGPGCRADQSRVYLGGSDSGCHRSDVAEIHSARIAVAERINLACSGGQTRNIWRASSGGTGQRGEAPQADQLLKVAREKDVEVILLSIGGNDLGFAGIVSACLRAYLSRSTPCHRTQQAPLDEKVPKATADVQRAIDEIRIVMAEAGYGVTDYRLIVQTYPSVIPRARELRYPQDGPERTAHACPLYDEDLDWGRDRAAPQIGAMVKAAAAARGAEILDLRDAFQGHEFCSTSTREVSLAAPADPAANDWGRFLGASTVQQGELQEAFHPNAFGQLALGDCVSELLALGEPGRFTCSGGPGRAPDQMTVTRTASYAVDDIRRAAPPLRIAAARRALRRRICMTFRVTSAGRPVRDAEVRWAGRSYRTDRDGRVRRVCRVVRGSRYRASASKPGYRPASMRVIGRR